MFEILLKLEMLWLAIVSWSFCLHIQAVLKERLMQFELISKIKSSQSIYEIYAMCAIKYLLENLKVNNLICLKWALCWTVI